jgi:hypothetical protein
MRAAARHALSDTARYHGRDVDEDYFDAGFVPSERIGPPLRSRRKAVLQGVLLLLIVVGIAWAQLATAANPLGIAAALLRTAMDWVQAPPRTGKLSAAVSPSVQPEASPPVVVPPAVVPPVIPVAVPANLQRPTAGDVDPAASRSAALSAPAPASATSEEEAPAERLPPPTVDANDPYQKRAIAVGLHPGLSHVLLAKLSPTDYRNAGIAIQTALAKTPEGGVYVWPRDNKPDLAVFRIHFVAGAAPGCRRYVVVVAKDRWLTTAAPMERCNSQAVGQR